jgi:ubiquinone/menaquinone biosynthesis C-methylase UbiE
MDTHTFITKRYTREGKIKRRTKEGRITEKTWLQWLCDDTVDSWRHRRMLQSVDPIIASYPKATWLTIGDGRFGNEAHYIWKKGGNVVASNISDELLKRAKKINFIPSYRVENAEKLSLQNNSFDFILCQESLHHFPRPFVGLYEMIRVAKKGVIITEPNDIFHDHTLAQKLFWCTKMTLKKLFGIKEIPPFETVGNYLYRVSVSEIEKLSTALNLPLLAYKGINDKYYEGVEFADMPHSVLYIKVRSWIWLLDALCNIGFLKHNDISIIIWKTIPSKKCLLELRLSGFHMLYLPKNPYV